MNLRASHLWLLFRLTEGCFWGLYLLVKWLPARIFCYFARPLLGLVICTVVPRGRIIRNLTAAFGETYSIATKKGLANGVREHFVKNLIDCFFQLRFPGYAQRVVTIEGRENLEAALAKGKGIIALGAHIGNFVLVGSRLGAEGLPFYALFHMPRDDRIQAIIRNLISNLHQHIIPSLPKRAAVAKILNQLRRKSIVFILSDNLRKGKVQTQLFGQPVRTSRGPVSLALRSGAPVLPIYLIRSYKGERRLIIEPEVIMGRSGDLTKDIVENTCFISSHLEELIRRYPDQWSWLTVRMRCNQNSGDPSQRQKTATRDLGCPVRIGESSAARTRPLVSDREL